VQQLLQLSLDVGEKEKQLSMTPICTKVDLLTNKRNAPLIVSDFIPKIPTTAKP
jgi:hypothetical protein